jgi:uncharacterized LabA/DUF88 family protein
MSGLRRASSRPREIPRFQTRQDGPPVSMQMRRARLGRLGEVHGYRLRGLPVPHRKNNKLAIFVDGANLYSTVRTLGFDIDYKRLLAEFQSGDDLLRAFYYTATIEDQEYTSIRPLIDWLDYNGFTVVTKPAKEFSDGEGRRKIKGNMAVELAVDALQLAEHVDRLILFSGDGDFCSLVQALQRRGVHVTVVSTISAIADELRRQADVFIDLVGLQSKLGRDPCPRATSR